MKTKIILLNVCIVMLLIIIPIGYYSCSDDCDPCGECETLDEGTCECITDIECRCSNGVKDGDEEFIDCGGDCADCIWASDACNDLTGESQRTWTLSNPQIHAACYSGLRHSFRVDHTATITGNCGSTCIYTWNFDDPNDPKYLEFSKSNSCDDIKYAIVTLNEDTLTYIDHYGFHRICTR